MNAVCPVRRRVADTVLNTHEWRELRTGPGVVCVYCLGMLRGSEVEDWHEARVLEAKARMS